MVYIPINIKKKGRHRRVSQILRREYCGLVFKGRGQKTENPRKWTTSVLIMCHKTSEKDLVVSLLRMKLESAFPYKPPVFSLTFRFLIYKAEKKIGRVSMGNHHLKNHSAVHFFFKDKKSKINFQIFF